MTTKEREALLRKAEKCRMFYCTDSDSYQYLRGTESGSQFSEEVEHLGDALKMHAETEGVIRALVAEVRELEQEWRDNTVPAELAGQTGATMRFMSEPSRKERDELRAEVETLAGATAKIGRQRDLAEAEVERLRAALNYVKSEADEVSADHDTVAEKWREEYNRRGRAEAEVEQLRAAAEGWDGIRDRNTQLRAEIEYWKRRCDDLTADPNPTETQELKAEVERADYATRRAVERAEQAEAKLERVRADLDTPSPPTPANPHTFADPFVGGWNEAMDCIRRALESRDGKA